MNFNLTSYTSTQLQSEIDSFKNGMKKGPFLERMRYNLWSLDDKVYFDAVYQGYLDASRRFQGVNTVTNRLDILHTIADEIKNCNAFNSLEDFDIWHEKSCELFIKLFKNENYTVSYGLAQKVINMAFKYLYCCVNSDNEKTKFKHCHMPLDSFILDWYFSTVGTKPNVVWSKLDKNEYKNIISNIRLNLKDSAFTNLENEFIIWAELTK